RKSLQSWVNRAASGRLSTATPFCRCRPALVSLASRMPSPAHCVRTSMNAPSATLPTPARAVTVGSGVSSETLEALDQQLRAAVRREGVDPQRGIDVVRHLARSLVREHDDRSLTGVVSPVDDPATLVEELVARVSGFGALQPLLDDPSVEEIWINDPS